MKYYSISQASKLTKLQSSTLRYYEQEGLLKNIKRDSNNRRKYSEEDIELINMIKCFKELGMSIKHIKKYLDNIQNNLCSVDEILKEHLNFLINQKNLIDNHIDIIKKKIT